MKLAQRDARHCPRCGARGILPLDQTHGDHGEIVDPFMICPVCEEEFRAKGVTWLGAFSPPNVADMTDDETVEAAKAIGDWFREQVERNSSPSS